MSDNTPEEKPAATAPAERSVAPRASEIDAMRQTVSALAAAPWNDETLRLRAIVFLTRSATRLREMEHAAEAAAAASNGEMARWGIEREASERAIEREERHRAEELALHREAGNREEKRIHEDRQIAREREAEALRRQDASETRARRRAVVDSIIERTLAAGVSEEPMNVEKTIDFTVRAIELLKALDGI